MTSTLAARICGPPKAAEECNVRALLQRAREARGVHISRKPRLRRLRAESWHMQSVRKPESEVAEEQY